MFTSVILTAALISSAAPQDDSHFIMGLIQKNAMAGTGISDYCSETGTTFLPESSAVFITGIKTCSPKYLTPVDFYEISWRGKFYYIKKDQVLITDDNKKRIDSYSELDWSLAKKEGDDGSIYLWQEQLSKTLKAVSTTATKGLTIVDWAVVDESEYTKGTGVRINVINPTKKTIKYIWFTVQGENPVGDKFGSPKTLRAVGPIEPDAGGSYRFEYVWMSDLTETANFRQIKVQYMDGSIKVIAKPSEIILDEDSAKILKE